MPQSKDERNAAPVKPEPAPAATAPPCGFISPAATRQSMHIVDGILPDDASPMPPMERNQSPLSAAADPTAVATAAPDERSADAAPRSLASPEAAARGMHTGVVVVPTGIIPVTAAATERITNQGWEGNSVGNVSLYPCA